MTLARGSVVTIITSNGVVAATDTGSFGVIISEVGTTCRIAFVGGASKLIGHPVRGGILMFPREVNIATSSLLELTTG